MAIAIDDLKALDQGSVVLWEGTSDGYDVPFFLVAFVEGLAWLSPNGTTYAVEALEEVADELSVVHTAVVPDEAKQ